MLAGANKLDEDRHLLEQRASAMKLLMLWMGGSAGLACAQLVGSFYLDEIGTFTEQGARVSVLLNLAVILIGTPFYIVNRLATKKWKTHEATIYRLSLIVISYQILMHGLWHIHNAGSHSSSISAYITALFVTLAWFLPRIQFRVFAVITTVSTLGLIVLEVSGILPYAPIFIQHEVIADIYLTPSVVIGTPIMVFLVTGNMAWIMRYVRNRLENANTILEREVAQRTAELDKAREEEKELRDQLAYVSKVASLGELTASVAHELNQPLAAILNNATAGSFMADMPTLDAARIKNTFDDIADDDRRASATIRTLRRLFHFGDMTREAVSINAIVDDVLTLIHRDALKHGIEIHQKPSADLPLIEADRVQLDHLLLNLVRNAIDSLKTTAENTRFIIIAAKSINEEEVELTIRDNGPGFDTALLQNLFESFVTTKADGLGIGLSLCRTIVERHGGRISADNHPDGGAAVRVVLPVADKGEIA